MLNADTIDTRRPRPAFGRWLLSQRHRADQVGELAKAAQRDAKFPREGNPEDVSARLNTLAADHEMHVALEDAELDWSAY